MNEPSTGTQGRLRLSDFLRDERSLILAEWERAVRLRPIAQGLSHPRLLDHLPHLLEQVASVVDNLHSGEDWTLAGLSEVHALQRLEVGFDLEEVAHEYALLRACILRLYRRRVGRDSTQDVALTLLEVERFCETFDEAVSAAVSRYARVRERTLVALDRISEAALGQEALDSFQTKLLRVILETTESVDSVTLLLSDGDTLRVRASVGLEEDVLAGLSVKVGEGFVGKVARERHPLELRSAATDPLVMSQALRARGTRALYGVPLLHGGELIGVAHMGSRIAYEFSSEDKLLFRTMVSRVTSLIVQAQLAASERAAREEEAKHKQLLDLVIEQSGDAIIMVDEQGVLRLFNAEAERLHGVSWGQVATPEWTLALGLLSQEGRPLPLEELPLYRSLRGEVVKDARWKVRSPDGTVRILSGSALPLRRPDGSLAGAVLTARDETERLRREREQAETLALLDLLLASVPIGLAFVDRQLRFVRINRMLSDINGVPVERTVGRTLREVLPDSVSWLEPLHRRVFDTGQPVVDMELTGPSACDGGRARNYLLSFYPVGDGQGVVRWVSAVVVDITERKRDEEELLRAAEFRERFLGIVSHDLRNPLNAILLSANVLLRAEDLPSRHTRSVRRVVTSAERMTRMIGELLDFTRGRLGGGIPISPRPDNLRHACRHVLEELEAAHPGRELRLEGDGDFRGEWDGDRLAQALGNLGKNALDYSPEDTPVRFSLRDEGDTLRVEVHNEGPPIPEQLLPTIFEPFRRASDDTAHPMSGLGLGLFIVREIVRAHQGELSVRSCAEEGTTFSLWLPRKAGD